jgi:hypothetical protein
LRVKKGTGIMSAKVYFYRIKNFMNFLGKDEKAMDGA